MSVPAISGAHKPKRAGNPRAGLGVGASGRAGSRKRARLRQAGSPPQCRHRSHQQRRGPASFPWRLRRSDIVQQALRRRVRGSAVAVRSVRSSCGLLMRRALTGRLPRSALSALPPLATPIRIARFAAQGEPRHAAQALLAVERLSGLAPWLYVASSSTRVRLSRRLDRRPRHAESEPRRGSARRSAPR